MTEQNWRDLAQQLAGFLEQALERMDEEEQNQERGVFGLGCGNCIAAVPMPHSWGCKASNAVWETKRALAAPGA